MEPQHIQDAIEQEDRIIVRSLRPSDFDAAVAVDAKIVGRRRDEYLRIKFQQNLGETGVQMSLAAEVGGVFCGFLLGRVFYGEFGRLEPAAVLDTIDVHPDYRKQGVGAALLRQLKTNLLGLGVSRLQTEVSWDDQALVGFFHHEGFRPAERICLELDLRARPPR